LLEQGKKPSLDVTMKTFAVSAFWHGFYPFYYFMFFWAGMCLELAKEFFRNKDLFAVIPLNVRWVICNVLSMM
jgi:hypothetical protein